MGRLDLRIHESCLGARSADRNRLLNASGEEQTARSTVSQTTIHACNSAIPVKWVTAKRTYVRTYHVEHFVELFLTLHLETNEASHQPARKTVCVRVCVVINPSPTNTHIIQRIKFA